MLKWTVANKRDALPQTEKPEHRRRSTAEICTGDKSAAKPKRRRSSTARRTSASRRSHRASLCLDLGKENQYTSTPIKGSEETFQQDVFRDVSNLTPTRKKGNRCGYSPKKKKQCVDPSHSQDLFLFSPDTSKYFKGFEAVDSHIEGLTSKDYNEMNFVLEEKPILAYAPTLPKLAFNNNSPNKKPIVGRYKNFSEIRPSNKKAKIDPVNDFLQQISNVTSPEETRHLKDLKVSPLVKRLVDLKFKKVAKQEININNSSFINDLSLDKIVDAILDSSNESNDYTQKRSSITENELNETQEENIINSQTEKQISNFSPDSGFRSETHEIEPNFTCKCYDQTIINLNATFNERSVDVVSRKRPTTSPETSISPKRLLLDTNCVLKRQKCIRRRKPEEKKDLTPLSTITDVNDHSFDSDDCLVNQETFVVEESRRFRRCLSFDSSENSSSSTGSEGGKGCENGVIDLDVKCGADELIISIFGCKSLRRTNGQPINAYVKVALSERYCDGRRKRKGTLQRTAVQAESCSPAFDESFVVPLAKDDMQKVLHVEVWHRDRPTRRSEFLGCLSFVIKNAIKKNISGSYHLLPQSSSRQILKDAPEMCESQSSTEEACFGLEADFDEKKTPSKSSLTQQQKDADENLFLRYLELDPTEGPEAAPAAAQRKATGNKNNGRTPFTTTKVLRRAPKSGFGFSVVWTNPPRIERVEKGLPADKAGILPGDYLIFVDKHNVVMMPEIDILNLIRSYGNQLTLETFRRSASRNGSVPSLRPLLSFETTGSSTGLPPAPPSTATPRRPSTVCSTNTASVEYNRKKLHLPQVTFSSERPTNTVEEQRRKTMYQIITREQQYATSLQFALARFVSSLAERKDLIGPAEHRILFQNSDEILRITEDILDNLVQDDGDYQPSLLLRTYHLKLNEITSAYKRYCSGIKKADCVLANLTKNQEFVRFTQVPAIPRRRPDLTVFIHKPLEHYREILKLFNVLLGHTKTNHEDYHIISLIVHELQVSYREMTSEAGLMEPMGEGRPLLSVQDLENRLVFTKCKPFVLTKPGRQWIFGGDLSRVEGRTVRPYWALLFSDILLFAKVSRDRVLFILEDPLPLAQITDFFFNVRKKANEFRIILEPGGGKAATSPTVHCGPDLSRTPRKNPSRRCVILRTPTVELKAVWQNLLQRQIFHLNASGGADGSSLSSPLECSPDVLPITSSAATLQSASSLSLSRRQTPRNTTKYSEQKDQKKHIDELIEHKCKQLEKSSSSSKSNAIHLEQWMKGQFEGPDDLMANDDEEEEELEVWTEDQIRKRSQELQLVDVAGKLQEAKRSESRCEDITFSDHELSPSRSTKSTESQVTVRSSPLVPETVNVCRQCHKTCVPVQNGQVTNKNYNICRNNNHESNLVNCSAPVEDDWRPLMLMGLSALNPTASLVKLDPFAAPLPQISVLPPTPELQISITHSEFIPRDDNCNCQIDAANKPQVGELILNKDYDNSPDDSPLNDEQPYHSLNSSNLTLRRYGTVSSLERVGSEDREDEDDLDYGESASCDEESDYGEEELEEDEDGGIDNEVFNHSSIMSWTARAGTFVAEKMAFFERYLKNEITVNGDEVQEEETSGATSGEEIWGTPTSGGELDEPLSYEERNSANGEDSLSSNEDTELMMDELLMTPPVTSATIRGLLPRRTLEPLMEEEYSDTYTSSSSSSTHTEPSVSPEKGNEIGDAADECSAAAQGAGTGPRTSFGASATPVECLSGSTATTTMTTTTVANEDGASDSSILIHRSDSYRQIIQQEDDNVGFFNRFRHRPSMKFINIERIPQAKGVKFLEFFNVRRERKIYETFPGGKHLIKVFSREGDYSDDVPTSYAEKPENLRRLKERQLDRRFWKQLSKRRGNKPIQLSA